MRSRGSTTDESRFELDRALRAVGRVLRIVNTVIALVLIIASSVPVLTDRDVTGVFLVGIPAVVCAMLAFRVRASMVGDHTLLVTGYVRSSRVELTHVDVFVDTPYAGWWNGFSGIDGWVSFRLRMLEIEQRGGRTFSLPETVCRGRHATRIADLLNAWADENSPISERVRGADR